MRETAGLTALADLARRWEGNQEYLLCMGEPASLQFGATWIVTPNLPSHRFNHVSQIAIAPHQAEQLITSSLSFFPARGIGSTCIVLSPATEPGNLGELLEHWGFRPLDVEVMVHRRPVSISPRVPVEVLDASPTRRDAFLDILDTCFFAGSHPIGRADMRRWWAASMQLGVCHVIAYVNGYPAGIGSLFCHAGVAGVYNMATAPGYRRRGIAAAVMDALLERAGATGCEFVALTPSEMGRPLYAALGFDVAYSERHFIHEHKCDRP